MADICLQNSECQQYCSALDSLASVKTGEPCQWPERLSQDYTFTDVRKPEVTRQVADHLLGVLRQGNKLQALLDNPTTELATALQAEKNVFSDRLGLWRSYADAAKNDRVLTDVEVVYYTKQLQATREEADTSLRAAGVSAEASTQARAMQDRLTIEQYGLLFDDSMNRIVTHLCANAASGQSTLLIGDKGIAKTQAAKFVSGLFAADGKPKFISGDGSMMKDEFIGKMTLTEQNGATVTNFQHGILTECAAQGVPLVMDEINLIDPAIAMRLQEILLLKPGDWLTIQEDGGEPILIRQGFCVFATANEASSRYRSRAALDPAFRDRFAVLPIDYPDGDTTILRTDTPPFSLQRLAYAYAISQNGTASRLISPDDALWLAAVAHASQQLYSKPAKDVKSGPLGTNMASIVDDTEPRMSDCITPRKMVYILQKATSGLNPYDIRTGVRGMTMDIVAAMQHRSDRETMYEVIRLMHDSNNLGNFDETKVRKHLRI